MRKFPRYQAKLSVPLDEMHVTVFDNYSNGARPMQTAWCMMRGIDDDIYT